MPRTGRFRGKLILLVDDELFVGLELQAMLLSIGAKVPEPCLTATEALERLSTEKFDAAILDIGLAQGTTESVAIALAEKSIPFFFYSGQKLPPGMAAQWPAVRVIAKPGSRATLLEGLGQLLPRPEPKAEPFPRERPPQVDMSENS